MTRFSLASLAFSGLLSLVLATPALAREWADSTGAYKVEATLVKVEGDKVVLRRSDGDTVTIPISRLSAADQKFVRSLTDPKKTNSRVLTNTDVAEILAKPPRKQKFQNTPLSEVVQQMLGDNVPHYIDANSLQRIGRNPNAPVVFETRKQASLLTNLNAMLAPAEMAASIQNGVVVLHSKNDADNAMQVSVFRLGRPTDYDALIGDITSKIEPTSWDEVGGPGSIASLPPVFLVVRASLPVTQKIAETYATKMKLLTRKASREKPDGAIEAKLLKPATAAFVATPLADSAAFLSDAHKVEIKIDGASLAKEGITVRTPVYLQIKNVHLEVVLDLMLKSHGLTYLPETDKITITSNAKAKTTLQKRSYPLGLWAKSPDALVRVVQLVEPTNWSIVGGASEVKPTGKTLEINTDWHTHRKLSELFNTLGSR